MRYYNDYGPMVHYDDGGLHLIGLGIMLLVLVIVVLIAMRLMRRHGGSWMTRRDSIDIAKDRYARGEITKEQFDQLVADLKQHDVKRDA